MQMSEWNCWVGNKIYKPGSQESRVDYNYKFGNSHKKVFKTYVLDESNEEVSVDREGKIPVGWNLGALQGLEIRKVRSAKKTETE